MTRDDSLADGYKHKLPTQRFSLLTRRLTD
jgi:hypothetical protein